MQILWTRLFAVTDSWIVAAAPSSNDVWVAGGLLGSVAPNPDDGSSRPFSPTTPNAFAARVAIDGDLLRLDHPGAGTLEAREECARGVNSDENGEPVVLFESLAVDPVTRDLHRVGSGIVFATENNSALQSFQGASLLAVALASLPGDRMVAVLNVERSETVRLDGIVLSPPGTVVVVAFDATGALTWARRLGGRIPRQACSVASDSDGKVLVTAWERDLLRGPVAVVTKLDANGNLVSEARFTAIGGVLPTGAATLAGGNIVMVGCSGGEVALEEQAASFASGEDDTSHAFVARLDTGLNVVWARLFGGDGSQAATSVAPADDGTIVVAGHFDGSLALDGVLLQSTPKPAGFIVTLDASGAVLDWCVCIASETASTTIPMALCPMGADWLVSGYALTNSPSGETGRRAFWSRFTLA